MFHICLILSTDVWPFYVTLLLSFVMHCSFHPQGGNTLRIKRSEYSSIFELKDF